MGFKTLHSVSSYWEFTKPCWVIKGSEKFCSKETLKKSVEYFPNLGKHGTLCVGVGVHIP